MHTVKGHVIKFFRANSKEDLIVSLRCHGPQELEGMTWRRVPYISEGDWNYKEVTFRGSAMSMKLV